jgi:eukaryotic translation initiation factor 2-alpha kinase 4
VQHDSSKRPTASELLNGQLLPPKIENDVIHEAMRSLVNPNNPQFKSLINSLFKQPPDRLKDYTFDYNTLIIPNYDYLLNSVLDYLRLVYRKHGAHEFNPPLLVPKNIFSELRNTVTMMNVDGSIVELPYDLTYPFARWISRRPVDYLKRYSIEHVFRKNITGGQAKGLLESDFDIVHSGLNGKYVFEAEVIIAVSEVLEPFVSKLIVRINHGKILQAIFQYLKIPSEDRFTFSEIVGHIDIRKSISIKSATQQFALKLQIPESTISLFESLCSRLSGHLKHAELPSRLPSQVTSLESFREGYQDITRVIRLVEKHFSNEINFEVDPLYTTNYMYYQDNTLFQIVVLNRIKKFEVYAIGGRYDSLISQMRHPNLHNTPLYGVGANISLPKLLAAASDASFQYSKKHFFNLDLGRKSVDVLVASFGNNVSIEERLAICSRLWSNDVYAEYVSTDEKVSQEELLIECRLKCITWLLILKDNKDKNLVKLKSVADSKFDMDFKLDEALDYIVSSTQGHFKPSQRRSVESGKDFSNLEDNVKVEVFPNSKSTSKPKGAVKRSLIKDKALRSLQSFLQNLIGSTLVFKACDLVVVELPCLVIKRICSTANFLEDESFRKEVLSSLPAENKDYALNLRTFIIELRKREGHGKTIFLYSLLDDYVDVLRL